MSKKGDLWSKRTQVLMNDAHVRAQVERLMPAATLIHGTKDVRTVEEYHQEVAQLIAVLETHPEIERTANSGGIVVERGPMQGYSILLWAADVYVMHMGDVRDPEQGTRDWRTANQLWEEGQEARFKRIKDQHS